MQGQDDQGGQRIIVLTFPFHKRDSVWPDIHSSSEQQIGRSVQEWLLDKTF